MTIKTWTDASVLRIAPPADKLGKEATVWHPTIKRFGIRFRRPDATSSWGVGTYTVVYFQGGRDHPTSIGKVGQITIAAAQAKAQQTFADVANGLNPRIEQDKAEAVHNDVFKAAIPGYLQHLGAKRCKAAYVGTTERYLTRYFRDLQELPVQQIGRRHVAAALERLLKPGPSWSGGVAVYVQARRALSAYFEWLLKRGLVESNPVHGTEQYKIEAVDRTLTEAELRRVWNAIDGALVPSTARLFKLLVLTGCRRNEIGNLRKAAVDLGEVPVIRLTADETKNGKPFVIPISRQAAAILRAQLQDAPDSTPYVFGRDGAAGGFQGFEKAAVALRKQTGDVEHWSLHDLRRTFVSLGYERLQLDPSVLDACLSHTPEAKKGVAGVYQRAELLERRAQVAQAWGDYCESLTAPAKPKLQLVA